MKGYRTIIFNLATPAVTLANILPPKAAAYTAIIGNAVLRVLTTTPIGEKE